MPPQEISEWRLTYQIHSNIVGSLFMKQTLVRRDLIFFHGLGVDPGRAGVPHHDLDDGAARNANYRL